MAIKVRTVSKVHELGDEVTTKGENCIMRSFRIYTLYEISYGRSDQNGTQNPLKRRKVNTKLC